MANTAPSTASTALTRETNDAFVKGQTRYLDTATAYDLWSEVYDTDGNFLQALDTIQMRTLLPRAVSLLSESPISTTSTSSSNDQTSMTWKVVDLGCGTGRNTVELLDMPSVREIVALDLSPNMLDGARRRCQSHLEQGSIKGKEMQFAVYDMIATPNPPEMAINADLIVSTLVLEHVELHIFFKTAASMLRHGGLLLLTNMHSEMGNISQAGFVDPKTGDKIRPVSYPHTINDTIEESIKQGFEVVGHIEELSVDEGMVDKLGPRGKKWVGVNVWFGGIWRKLRQ